MRFFSLRPTIGDDLAFIRRWAAVLLPAWCLAAFARWRIVDSYDATMALLWPGSLVFLLPLAFGVRLDNRPRLRRTGTVYLMGMLCSIVMHAIRGTLE